MQEERLLWTSSLFKMTEARSNVRFNMSHTFTLHARYAFTRSLVVQTLRLVRAGWRQLLKNG
jgi:hypothetical protein